MIDKEILNKMSLELIELKLKTNILYLTSDVCERKNIEGFYKDCKEVSDIKVKLDNLIVGLGEVLKRELNDRNDYLKDLINVNKELVTIAEPIFWYVNFANIVGKYVLKEYKLRQVANNEKVEFAKDIVLADCDDYLHSCNSGEVNEEQKVGKLFEFSQLLSCFPLRMTREKYEDYIKESFNILFKNLPVSFVESGVKMLRNNFAPFTINNFKEYYPLVTDMLDTIFNMDLKQSSTKEIEELLDNIDDIVEKSESIREDFKMLYDDINYMITLTLFCIDPEYIFEDDFIIKDLYYSACDIITNDNNNFLADSINDSVIDKIDYLTERIKPIEDKFNKILSHIKNNDINIYEDFDNAVKTKLLIDEYFKHEITDEFAKISNVNDTVYADNEFVKQKAIEFIDFINSVSETIDNKRMKFLKQNFFNCLPCPLNYNSVMEYIEYSLESIENDDSLFVVISEIMEFFNNVEFILNDLDDNGDCSCEDNHHHDHNCSCGHHH